MLALYNVHIPKLSNRFLYYIKVLSVQTKFKLGTKKKVINIVTQI